MTTSNPGETDPDYDPDADPEMVQSKAKVQPSQAEGEDDASTGSDRPTQE